MSVVIVGASMGGLRAAESLRRFGYTGPITAIGDEVHPPYNRPPLSKEVLAADVSLEAVAFPMRPATADVNWMLGTKVIAADLDARTVETATGEKISFEHLIIATGLRPKRLDYPNSPSQGRHVIRSLEDAMALRAAIKPGAKVVILGAGFIGCETGATAIKLGAEVTIVGPGHLPIKRPLGDALAAEVMRRHEAMGTQFKLGQRVVDLLGNETVTGVLLDDGSELACDVYIEAVGSHANVEWLEGNDLDLTDGVLTNHQLAAVREDGDPYENVWAIGDVARFPNPTFDDTARRVEHWNIPTECAKFVGQSIAAKYGSGDAPETFKPIPSFWSDQFDMHILAFGLLGLATEIKLIEGEISGDCVFGYYRGEKMVGVAGIGLRSVVQSYRKVFE